MPPAPPPPQQPGQPPPQQQDDGLDDAALAVAIAALLAGAAVTAAYAGSVAAMLAVLKARFRLSSAAWQALGAVLSLVLDHPHAATGIIGPASEQVSRMNTARRAQYVVAASKRVVAAAREASAKGESVTGAAKDQLARERKFFEQHQAAMWNRARAAGQVDIEAAVHGRLLGWNTHHPDGRVTPECADADGKNFYADRMPDIGFPGAAHPRCRCFPSAPHPGGKLLPASGLSFARAA